MYINLNKYNIHRHHLKNWYQVQFLRYLEHTFYIFNLIVSVFIFSETLLRTGRNLESYLVTIISAGLDTLNILDLQLEKPDLLSVTKLRIKQYSVTLF